MDTSDDIQPILDVQLLQLELTFSASASMDSKSIGIFGAVIALAIFTLQSQMQNNSLLLIAVFVFYSLAIACNIVVLWRRNYIGPGVDIGKHPEYLSMSDIDQQLQVLADVDHALDVNEKSNEIKSKWLSAGFITAGLSMPLLVWCIL